MEQYIKHQIRSKSVAEIIGWRLLIVISIIALALLLGFGIMWLCNWLMPDIFELTTIGYWQAIGLFILAKVLLRNCGSGSSSSSKNKEKSFSKNSGDECGDFSKWKSYDEFWKEEGEKAFKEYITQQRQEKPRLTA